MISERPTPLQLSTQSNKKQNKTKNTIWINMQTNAYKERELVIGVGYKEQQSGSVWNEVAHIQHTCKDMRTNAKSRFNRKPTSISIELCTLHPAPTDMFLYCFIFPPLHTWLKTVHQQHDTTGLNGTGLITALRSGTVGVHTKKKSIHKCTGRWLLLEQTFEGSSVTTRKVGTNMREGHRQDMWITEM